MALILTRNVPFAFWNYQPHNPPFWKSQMQTLQMRTLCSTGEKATPAGSASGPNVHFEKEDDPVVSGMLWFFFKQVARSLQGMKPARWAFSPSDQSVEVEQVGHPERRIVRFGAFGNIPNAPA